LGVQQQVQENLTKEAIKKYQEDKNELELRKKVDEIKVKPIEQLEGKYLTFNLYKKMLNPLIGNN
jgi:hypothetical protein